MRFHSLIPFVKPMKFNQDGVIVTDTSGTIRYIDDLAIILLRREFPHWLSNLLPQEVMSEIAGGSRQQYVGKQVVMNLRHKERVMVINVQTKEARRVLTQAERRVVENILRHGSYKEAARQMGVSHSTVRNQLHAIYRKLGIKGKSELIRAFNHQH